MDASSTVGMPSASAADAPATPAVDDRATFQTELDGRPIAQWSRLEAGRSDDLGINQD